VAGSAGADDWRGTIEGGRELRVDPQSRRAFSDDGSGSRPMWDGVHRLEDGSMVIIRDGIAVPTRDMLETWSPGPSPTRIAAGDPCGALVEQTCGRRSECEGGVACNAARQLAQMRRDAERNGEGPGALAELDAQCTEAQTNPFFTPCQ
jgi:hypothetical protein